MQSFEHVPSRDDILEVSVINLILFVDYVYVAQ